MDEDIPQRMQVINTMLLEMAAGNFHYRIERTPNNDNVEALVVTLNMLAEEIQGKIIHQGYVNTDTSFLDIVQISILLDGKGVIQLVNQQTCTILSALYTDIIGQPFATLLTPASAMDWNSVWEKLQSKDLVDASLQLTFTSKGNLVVPKTAYITRFAEKRIQQSKTLVTVIHHTSVQHEMDTDLRNQVISHRSTQNNPFEPEIDSVTKPRLRLSYEDIRKIRHGHDIIINNLEQDFPSLRDFALQLGTNEFKLKYGFRELYGTSVYRFLSNERLRKAKMLIQYSELSLKNIAYMTGFKSLPHFSRSFKKRYDFSPSDLRNNSLNNLKQP